MSSLVLSASVQCKTQLLGQNSNSPPLKWKDQNSYTTNANTTLLKKTIKYYLNCHITSSRPRSWSPSSIPSLRFRLRLLLRAICYKHNDSKLNIMIVEWNCQWLQKENVTLMKEMKTNVDPNHRLRHWKHQSNPFQCRGHHKRQTSTDLLWEWTLLQSSLYSKHLGNSLFLLCFYCRNW